MSKRKTTHEFIIDAKLIHGDRYDYSKVVYKSNKQPVNIICNRHGEFPMRPDQHLFKKRGCSLCSPSGKRNRDYYLEKFIEIHGNKYDYKNFIYKTTRNKIKIICKKHGEFIQDIRHHLKGCGCPFCNESKGENCIRLYLDKNKIYYDFQKQFKELGSKRFDFYLPYYNLLIEYDGEQHFRPVNHFGGKLSFKILQENDQIKTKFAESNGYELLRIPHYKFNEIEDILSKELNLGAHCSDDYNE